MQPMTCSVLVLAALLTGCTSTAPEGTGQVAPVDEGNASVTGVVVDNALRPLANATVRLGTEPPRSTVTAMDGAFAFTGLRPGAYPVEAAFPYHTGALVVAIAEVAPKSVTLILDPLPLERPFLLQYAYAGFHNWSVVAGSPIIHCCNIGESYQFDAVPDFLQTEVVWQAANALAEEMDLGWYRHGCEVGSGPCQNRTLGPSPLEFHQSKQQLIEWDFLNNNTFSFRVLAADREDTRPPTVCDPVGLTCTAGIGASIQQRFDVYTTAFFNFSPPDGWRFSSDGLPGVPP